MFEINISEAGAIRLNGRLDSSNADAFRKVCDKIIDDTVLDFQHLDYISSAGLGILLSTQQRLGTTGHTLHLVNLNNFIKDVFRYAGFERLFNIVSE